MREQAYAPSTRSLRILIVEDERRLAELWQRELRGIDVDVLAAPDGEEGLALMEREPADVVLLDLALPRMDGIAFLERLRARWSDVPVIIITAYGSLESAQRAIRLGVSEYLRKPCHLGDLEAAIARTRPKAIERRARRAADEYAPEGAAGPTGSEAASLAELERRAIFAALDRFDGNRSAAARALGISRRTLYNKLDEYGEGRR